MIDEIEQPPEGMSVKEWNRQRREEIRSGKKRSNFQMHRPLHDRLAGAYKVRPKKPEA